MLKGELTPRQAEIVGLRNEGLDNVEIGKRLGMKPQTVQSTVSNARAKGVTVRNAITGKKPRLTEEQIAEIRKIDMFVQANKRPDLAKRYGVSVATIQNVIWGIGTKHHDAKRDGK